MGLKELAHVAGYSVAAIQSCGQFKRTHHFLMEVWQAVFQVMIQCFIKANEESCNTSQHLTDVVGSALLHVKSSRTEVVARLAQLQQNIQQSKYHE